EANFGTASHGPAASANSPPRAGIGASTRGENHGLDCPALELKPLKISRVVRISCAAAWQPSHAATWWRCAADQLSVNSSIRAAAGRAAAESSNKSRNFGHSSWFFFSRFHIPASLPLLLSASISALLCLTYHPAPGPKESHFHRVAIQIQNFRDLLDRISFHFLQEQHQPVPFIQSFQQPLHVLPRFHLLAD